MGLHISRSLLKVKELSDTGVNALKKDHNSCNAFEINRVTAVFTTALSTQSSLHMRRAYADTLLFRSNLTNYQAVNTRGVAFDRLSFYNFMCIDVYFSRISTLKCAARVSIMLSSVKFGRRLGFKSYEMIK